MKSPKSCLRLSEIRTAVNAIDRQIIKMLGKRAGYARAAFAFKTDLKSIGQSSHRKKMFAQRKAWAQQHGADVRMTRRIFQAIVDESKRMHLAAFRARQRAQARK